jgi:DNA (cytosine-5)-methyltransferase 1
VLKNFITEVETEFDGHRYNVKKYVLEAAKFGVPQFRTRVIIIGVLEGANLGALDDIGPRETHIHPDHYSYINQALLPYNTASDALRTLPSVKAPSEIKPRNHSGRVHGETIIQRYENLAFGERDSKTRINKLHPERPSYTIIVGSDKGGGKGHVHPFEAREVTPRESARMQSFPDWWGFSGTSRHPIRQIGNAVPPILAGAIGTYLLENIFRVTPPTREEIWRRLSQDHLLDAEQEKVNALLNTDQEYLLQLG